MKIDLHCHTRTTKDGENSKRNIGSKEFATKLKNYGLSIVAITNHNYFDKLDFDAYLAECDLLGIQLWPGIELDCTVDEESGHVLVIANPGQTMEFASVVATITHNSKPNLFSKTFQEIASDLASIDCIVIAHSSMKAHGFSDRACKEIRSFIKQDKIVMFEPSNLKSVGIMFANNICGFIGSDVSDWNSYPIDKIPELKMEVNSFGTFKLLIKKDPAAIKTFLEQKTVSQLELQPFEDEGDFSKIKVNLMDDINIIFGGKGTGKSKILASIKKNFSSKNGDSTISYYEGKNSSSEYSNLIKREVLPEDFNRFNIQNGSGDIESIKQWKNASIITTGKFYKGFHSIQSSNSANHFGFIKASFSELISDSTWKNSQTSLINISEAINKLRKEDIKKLLGNDTEQFLAFLTKLESQAKKQLSVDYAIYKSLALEQWTINTMKEISLTKTGNFSIPSSTGLLDVFCSSLKLYNSSKTLVQSINTHRQNFNIPIGLLQDKGKVVLSVNIFLNPEEETSIIYKKGKLGSRDLKEIKKALVDISKNSFSLNTSNFVDAFNSKAKTDFCSIEDFMGIKFYEGIDNGTNVVPYGASSGEQSMLLLDNALMDNSKEVYILDEPEISVGHKYINDIIVPRLKELSRMDKRVIISTHDANIAVRTIPLMTIYREYKHTYMGNLFTNDLIDEFGNTKKWVDTSLDYLEGGELAFLERGQSYGKKEI